MKILNLYAGIGGNRTLWEGHDIISVEQDPEILLTYCNLYPNDGVVCGDAHEFLLKWHDLFDFVWSSPPCQSHSQYRYNVGFKAKGYKPLYPDLKLYEEILFLQHYYKGKWVVENTKPFYKPLIEPTAKIGRHFFWSNFDIPQMELEPSDIRSKNKVSDFDIDLSNTKISNKRQVLRNCVDPKLGLHILENVV